MMPERIGKNSTSIFTWKVVFLPFLKAAIVRRCEFVQRSAYIAVIIKTEYKFCERSGVDNSEHQIKRYLNGFCKMPFPRGILSVNDIDEVCEKRRHCEEQKCKIQHCSDIVRPNGNNAVIIDKECGKNVEK